MSQKIRTLIVDDEPLARRNLRLLLEKNPQIESLKSVVTAEKRLSQLNS